MKKMKELTTVKTRVSHNAAWILFPVIKLTKRLMGLCMLVDSAIFRYTVDVKNDQKTVENCLLQKLLYEFPKRLECSTIIFNTNMCIDLIGRFSTITQ